MSVYLCISVTELYLDLDFSLAGGEGTDSTSVGVDLALLDLALEEEGEDAYTLAISA